MTSGGEPPPPGFERWVQHKLDEHGWGLAEHLVVLRVLEDYTAVLLEHEPSEVGAAGMLILLEAIDAGDLDRLREAGRRLKEDAVRRSADGRGKRQVLDDHRPLG